MEKQHYPFTLPPLPYAYDALEPFIDKLTMELHHDRHLKTYIDNLNAALKDRPEYQSWPLQRLVKNARWLPENIRTAVRHNAGGVYNHEFFFANLTNSPENMFAEPLLDKINATFGSYKAFQAAFKKQALDVFGSGYAWLAADGNGGLKIVETANQGTPLTLDLAPLMAIDVWEHAYYLKHYNQRAAYIDDWFRVADHNQASERYAAI